MGIPFGAICQGESKIAVCGRSLRRLLREGQGRGGGVLALRGDDAPLARSIMCPSSPTRRARMLLAPSAGRGAPTARLTPPRYTVMRGVDREYGKGGTERVWKGCLMKDTTFFTTVPRRMIFRRSCAVSTPSNAVASAPARTSPPSDEEQPPVSEDTPPATHTSPPGSSLQRGRTEAQRTKTTSGLFTEGVFKACARARASVNRREHHTHRTTKKNKGLGCRECGGVGQPAELHSPRTKGQP